MDSFKSALFNAVFKSISADPPVMNEHERECLAVFYDANKDRIPENQNKELSSESLLLALENSYGIQIHGEAYESD